MFPKEVYIKRRKELAANLEGLLIFPGNTYVSYNYPANVFPFRQDSNFLYFFGLNESNLFAVINADTGEEIIFGNDIDIDDIIWTGPLPSIKELAESVGVQKSFPLSELKNYIGKAKASKQKISILPPYRAETKIQLIENLSCSLGELEGYVSDKFIKGVVDLASIKDDYEIAEIEKAVDITYEMHVMAMKMAKPGIKEQEIAGMMQGIAMSKGNFVSFPVILSKNGHILHNHAHNNILQAGDLMVADAGAETNMSYAGDITRTTPIGGKFTQKQKEIYEIVLKANEEVTAMLKPGLYYREAHFHAARVITEGLKQVGLMKGDTEEAVQKGAHALFMPHGLGHMMGLDVHDMEGLGENFVGYDDSIKRSDQFGLAFLRLGRKLQKGFVLTNEPGLYFIPELIKIWKSENKFAEHINYDKVGAYLDFGGIRLEDDILVTETGSRVLGKPVPKSVKDVEEIAGTL